MTNYLNPYITDEELADEGCVRIGEYSRHHAIDDLVSDAYLTVKHYHYSDTVVCIYSNGCGQRHMLMGSPEEVIPQVQAVWAKAGGRDDC